jgi:hypothetical protein
VAYRVFWDNLDTFGRAAIPAPMMQSSPMLTPGSPTAPPLMKHRAPMLMGRSSASGSK